MKNTLIGLLAFSSISVFAKDTNLELNSRCHYKTEIGQSGKLSNNISLKTCIDEVKKQFTNDIATGYFEYTFYTKLPSTYNTSMQTESDASGYKIKAAIDQSNVESKDLHLDYEEF